MAGIWDFWIGSNGRFLVTCHGMLVNWSKMPWHVGWLVGFVWEKENEMLWDVGMGCGSHKKQTCPLKNTPRKFNIAPEKSWLEDYFPIGKVTFQGLC